MPVPKSIYGAPCKVVCIPKPCEPNQPNIPLLEEFLKLLEITTSVVDQFFPGIVAFAPFESSMSVTVGVTPSLYARMLWSQKWPGISFDKTNMTMLLQLRTLFVECGFNWRKDPILNKVKWNAC
jgi:hypothetical protein